MNEAFVLQQLFTLWGVLVDILYFCAGGIVFVILLCSGCITENMDKTGFRVYVICSFVIWCWVFSKLIVM